MTNAFRQVWEGLRRHAALLSVLAVAAAALALYSHILGLPFFRDDMVMLLWLRDMSWGRLWVDASGFPYYRPLSFSTLKLSELLYGAYQPQFLHAINLFFHAANAAMLATLTRIVVKQPGRTLAGLAAGLLYAAYPFTFEVMPTTGPIFQLQAAFFALAACLAYARWRCTSNPAGSKRWLCLALGLALLGSFTCEYSVIIPPLLIATELILYWQSRQNATHPPQLPLERRAHPRLTPLAFFLFTALYLVAWLLVPKTRSTLPWLSLHDMGYKALYYLQGLSYPLQPAALPLAGVLGLAPGEASALSGEWAWPALALLAGLALLGLALLLARHGRWDVLGFGLAWWAISLAPMWPTLNWDYTWNGPRLHYIPALGTTLLWGSAVGLLGASSRRLARALGGLVLLIALVPSLLFLRAQADVALMGGKCVVDVVEAVTRLPPGQPALVVNFPSWLKPAQQVYALGAEGITFLPGYSSMAELVALNASPGAGGQVSSWDVSSVTFTNVWKPWKFEQRFYTPALDWAQLLPGVRGAARVFEVQYTAQGLELAEAGRVRRAPPQAGALASFGEQVDLVGAEMVLGPTPSGQARRLAIRLDWTARAAVTAEWTVFLHVYDGSGALLAQGDGDPLLGLYPLWAWQPGDGVRDMRYVDLPAGLSSGRVGVGLYDRNSGQRIPASGAQADDVVILFEFTGD